MDEKKLKAGIKCHSAESKNQVNACDSCPYDENDPMLDPRIDPDYGRKVLEKCAKCRDELIDDCIEYIAMLEERIAIMSEGGWHFSGTPEIPEDEFYSYVLVWIGDKTVFPLVYHRRCVRGKDVFRYEWLNGDKYGAGKIKAWQYVPKPPKEGEAE